MAQPAYGKAPGITPSETVNITLVNGTFTPSVDPVEIPLGGSVEFVNQTSENVALELFTTHNDHHVAVSVYVAAGGNAYLCNDPQHSDAFCHYNIAAYPGQARPADNPSGSHTIQIGSGDVGGSKK